MSERKSINKYYPPDYNPLAAENAVQKAAKKLKSKNRDSITIRLMTPFSMRCLKCSEYIAKSRKFNGKKELAKERYLDTIKIYRFSIKCPRCNNVICFRTDPKSADYVMELGGKRNYEPATAATGADKIESVKETLERLVDAQKRAEIGNDADDKMEVLEKRLMKLEREREADEELELVKRLNDVRRANESKLAHQEDEVPTDDADADLDQLAEAAFAKRRSAPQPHTTAPSHQRVAKIAGLTKKKKKNPLGVTIKKR
ncbi:hypothetical protein HG535_0D03560 [Zygotorulaspora mrakii]|uniref:Splicing factor YJU2 n=1 Tax=Zygotorulaspora mrakii TaxID=42260 RepID=A0A7H9B1W5_ZYGMR|nr:uncharacterized protein HG535_0D03560 [Zygotorulaspora mrakii]QLG72648.1 hypothetical protein HG535_0D03560 [Zygotorulaspora mrakii]